MRRALLPGLLLAAAAAVPASAADPVGRPCGFALTSDPRPTTDPQQSVGVLYGGPYAGGGALVCTLQVGGARHSDPDAVARVASNADLVVLAPTRVELATPDYDRVWVCTQFTPDGGTPRYWTGDGLGGGRWSSDPDAFCDPERELPQDVLPPDCMDCGPYLPGQVSCTALVAARAPFADPAGPVYVEPGGDTYVAGELFWDCPPYAVT